MQSIFNESIKQHGSKGSVFSSSVFSIATWSFFGANDFHKLDFHLPVFMCILEHRIGKMVKDTPETKII